MASTILVGPTEVRPTHDLKLSDGTTTIGLHLCDGSGKPTPIGIRQGGVQRTSLQMRQGDPDYSAYELPYTPMTQKDWSGGRGQEDFGKDSTKYYDSYRIDTRAGDVVLGPKETEVSFSTPYASVGSSAANFGILYKNNYTSSFTVPTNRTVRSVSVLVRSDVACNLVVVVYADSVGSPGSPGIATGETGILYVPVQTSMTWVKVNMNVALTAATTYHLGITLWGTGYLQKSTSVGNTIHHYDSGGGLVTTYADSTMTYQLHTESPGICRFFDYKGMLMAVTRPDDGGAPKFFANGVYGYATSNSANKSSTNTTLDLSGLTLGGKVIRIAEGPGSTEEQSWREIYGATGTGSNDVIYVDPPWNIAQTTDSYFVVLGVDRWTEITGHGMTGPVTDVLVVDDIIYFSQGDSINIRRGRLTTGGWSWADDGTNKATFMALINGTDGTRRVWRANATTSQVSAAPVVAWGSNLTFSTTSATCGNPKTKITGLEPYGNPTVPWILKEDGIGSIGGTTATNAGVYAEVPLREMRSVADDRNGRAHCQFGVYLMFSLLDGMERYYDQRLDDIGPNLGEGFPSGRQGSIYHMIPYPGGVFACVDGGDTGFSSVLFWNQLGWHELYRGAYGKRIRRVHVQVIPGDAVDRLWISEGDTTYWIPICLNPRKQSDYTYYDGNDAHLISSWFYGGFKEINKFWKSLTLFSENLSAFVNVQAYYQTDTATDATAWTAIGAPTSFTSNPVQEIDLSSTYNVTGKRWRYKLVFLTNTTATTPRVKAVTADSITRIPIKRSWTVTFLADDAARQLSEGWRELLSSDGLITQLMTWADTNQGTNSVKPLTMNHNSATYDNKRVFIDPLSISFKEFQINDSARRQKMVCSMTLYEA